MTLPFLQETNQSVLQKLKTELGHIDSTIDVDHLSTLTTAGLQRELSAVREDISEMKRGRYGSWLRQTGYVRNTLLEETLNVLLDDKISVMESEVLIPGAVYYSSVSRFGPIVEGKKAVYMGAKYTGWMEFRESAAVAKARQVLRHGDQNDFREIYIGMADGRPDALNQITLDHITESSEAALAEIEAYCDDRWDGAWPWEIEAPEKLKYMIEHREETNMKSIEEMQQTMGVILREFEEGGMDRFELVAATQEMMKVVDRMVADLAKLSRTSIEVGAQAKATGDEQLVTGMQAALGEPLNTAVAALTDLKASLTNATTGIAGGGGGMSSPAGNMGSPADAMGGDPMGGMDAPIDDVEIGGDEDAERVMKEI